LKIFTIEPKNYPPAQIPQNSPNQQKRYKNPQNEAEQKMQA
jgi:hypothetical protein